MLIDIGEPRELGSKAPIVGFSTPATSTERQLLLHGEPAYRLPHPCGTCDLLFERLGGAGGTVQVEPMVATLRAGLSSVDEGVLAAFGALLARDCYRPMLLERSPRLVTPGKAGDYFSEEHLATWGIGGYEGLPAYPAVEYYRTFETAVSPSAHLYEFVVPMVPPAWSNHDAVSDYSSHLAAGPEPTAVAISVLDVAAPAVIRTGTDESAYHEHWSLTHFLLDGHHKFRAAASTGLPVRLLSLLAVDAGIASAQQVAQLPALLRQPRAGRAT